MNDFAKNFDRLVGTVKSDPMIVFDSALTYILRFLSVDQAEVSWDYGEDENRAFYTFMKAYLDHLQEELEKRFWWDAWGDLFMELSGNYKSFRGQFFTPAAVSNLCARIVSGELHTINDCACGSGRMLLAAQEYAYNTNQRRPYLVAEDIDGMCCKMCAINFAVHGCVGEVIRHDSLGAPDTLQYGYLVNMNKFNGLPSIRTSSDPNDFWKIRNTKAKTETLQLSLFD